VRVPHVGVTHRCLPSPPPPEETLALVRKESVASGSWWRREDAYMGGGGAVNPNAQAARVRMGPVLGQSVLLLASV
jgi:hypothetical protein